MPIQETAWDTARDGVRPEQGEAPWGLDPADMALDASADRKRDRHEATDAFCVEVGRRMLLAELRFSGWVLRRVEKVRIDSDRSVSRRCSIELKVRDDAPVFVNREGERFWLVPLSIMRRRTLVNMNLRDEADESIMMPGIRLAQQLDESMLLAAAATTSPDLIQPGSALRKFVHTVVAGKKEEIVKTMEDFESSAANRPAFAKELDGNWLFTTILRRLRRSFTLYVFLPERAGRHRLLRISFDEPTDWAYQVPSLRKQDDGSYRYEVARRPLPWYHPGHMAAALGLCPTRVRFQVPSAENAASYHFEFAAPAGVQVVAASLLAGRPNEPERHVSFDHVVGHSPTVGLHAVEVPNGSLCRVQVSLGIPTRGWLTTLLVCSWLIVGVLVSVAIHQPTGTTSWSADEVTNIVVLLVSTSAGVAALIAQREAGGVGARLVAWMRSIGVIVTALPIVAAGILTYNLDASGHAPTHPELLWVLFGFAFVAAVLITSAWGLSRRAERPKNEQSSPWDMTDNSLTDPETDYLDALTKYGFDKAAVGIRSAENWHDQYDCDDKMDRAAVAALERPAGRVAAAHNCSDLGTTCASRHGCPVTSVR
jgi:hypothetical protein